LLPVGEDIAGKKAASMRKIRNENENGNENEFMTINPSARGLTWLLPHL
jgi:hypothetical protein